MGEPEHQDLVATVEELQARLRWAEASIEALVLAVERLNQRVNTLEVSKSEPFDSLFIRKQLETIMKTHPER